MTNLKLLFFCLIKHFDIIKFNCYLALSTFDIFHHFLFKPLVNGSNLFLVMCTIYARLLQLCPILTQLNPTDHMVFTTIWTVAGQDPLSMEFFRQEYWSGLLFPSAGVFPTQGANLWLFRLLRWQVGSLSPLRSGKPFSNLLDCGQRKYLDAEMY